MKCENLFVERLPLAWTLRLQHFATLGSRGAGHRFGDLAAQRSVIIERQLRRSGEPARFRGMGRDVNELAMIGANDENTVLLKIGWEETERRHRTRWIEEQNPAEARNLGDS